MRIITLNVEGLRQAESKGLFHWLDQQGADVVCLQDIREKDYQLEESKFRPDGWHVFFFDALEDGYSGTAIYTRQQPKAVMTGIGFPGCDFEGRYLQADFEHVSVVSMFAPKAIADEESQDIKNEFMEQFVGHLRKVLRRRREYIFCGTLNIAHKPQDIANWHANQDHSGFLVEETEFLDEVFYQLDFCDAFRQVNQSERQFTWWPDYKRAFKINEGARFDYQITTPRLRSSVVRASIYREERFSNYAPLTIDYELNI